MKNKLIFASIITLLAFTQTTFAFAPKETSRYYNGPKVSSIGTSSAVVSLSDQVLADITAEEKSGIYFEYDEKGKVCIMIYPTPVECLPKKTSMGSTTVFLINLKPNTEYTVKYKRDNTINCITTPCPTNSFDSLSSEFKTLKINTSTSSSSQINFKRDLRHGMRGKDVESLQKYLIEHGYLTGKATGYYGEGTRKAIKKFQKEHKLNQTGYFGKMTREIFSQIKGENFEGTINSFSTACFADGICSVTIDGKLVVIVRGWSQDIAGSLKGVDSIGDLEKKIGKRAKVYAAKTEDGNYTLYGNKNFYVEVQ